MIAQQIGNTCQQMAEAYTAIIASHVDAAATWLITMTTRTLMLNKTETTKADCYRALNWNGSAMNGDNMFTVYTKPNCTYCESAKTLLNQRGIPFTEIKIGVDIVREEVQAMFPNRNTVPIIVEDSGVIGGFQQLKEYIEQRGETPGELLLG